MLEGNVLITGGAGTLGKAIIKKAHEEDWPCEITIFSTDTMKHAAVKKQWPNVRFVVGDVRDEDALSNAIAGHSIVIHGAAVKHIPVSEANVIDTIGINVIGSLNVAKACIKHLVPKCIMISTDKACESANAYGATKYLMEKIVSEMQFAQNVTDFHLVRYGNVLESTGSVIEVWKNQIAKGQSIGVTDEEMTRFWLSPSMAVDYVIRALECPAATILVPKMKAMSIMDMAAFVTENEDFDYHVIGMRPGEKIHETLLMENELRHTTDIGDAFLVYPTSVTFHNQIMPYSSDIAPKLSYSELIDILEDN